MHATPGRARGADRGAPARRSSAAMPRAAAVLLALAAAACATAPRASTSGGGAPPAPAAPAASPNATPPAAPPAAPGRPTATDADARFMQQMLAHHAQALVMTRLVPERTARVDVRRLAERIAVSQQDEIAQMRRWLEARGVPVPDTGAHHGHHGGGAPMPGMLTPEELARLERATGPAFDRLFLQLMIRHHEGALTMVAELLASRGAAQDAAVFRFATDVDADQRAEIRRMQALLATLPDGATPR